MVKDDEQFPDIFSNFAEEFGDHKMVVKPLRICYS